MHRTVFPKQACELLTAFALILSALVCRATGNLQYSSRLWQTDHGLPHNAIYAVQQTRDGHLWIASGRGLSRFDGKRFKNFTMENTPEIKGAVMKAIYETRDGTLWLGTEESGLTMFKDGKFILCSWPKSLRIRSFLETRDGTLWLGTMEGLGRYKNGKCEWFMTTNGLPNNIILSLCEDPDGNLWIGTNHGLVRWKDGFHEVLNRDTGLPSYAIRALVCDHNGDLWVGTNGSGLARRRRNGEIQNFDKTHGLPDNFVWDLHEDTQGQLWIGTYGGLCRRVGDRFITETNSEGLSYETVLCLTEDAERNIWAGTKEGLAQLRPKIFTSYTKTDGLSHNNVMSVCEDRQGRILVGTWGGGLNVLQDSKFTVYNQSNGLPYDVILSLCDAKDGSVWLGTDYDGGMFRWKDGVFTFFGKEQGLIDNAVRVLQEDRAGNLWIGTVSALYLWREEKLQRFGKEQGFPEGIIRAIYEDTEGNLWIGTQNGLVCRRDGKFFVLTKKDGLSEDQIISIYEDKEQTLWVGTASGGVNRFKVQSLKFKVQGTGATPTRNLEPGALNVRSYTTKQGLFSDSIFEILEDDSKNLWMSCFSGLFRVAKQDLQRLDAGEIAILPCVAYGKSDGMSSAQCNGVAKPAAWKSRDGRFWFPTTRGLVTVNPAEVNEQASPPVMIEEVIADKKIQSLQFKAQSQEPGISHASLNLTPEPLSLPPGGGELEFHFAALSFRAPEQTQFEYKLEGVDDDWVAAGNRDQAFYNHLRPGLYQFLVRAHNRDGAWSSTGTALSLRLLPHFWQTWWFRALIILAVGTAVAGLARYTTRRRLFVKLQRLEEQNAVEKERNRIAQDMHDNLGARLTEILLVTDQTRQQTTSPAKVGQQLERISTSAREVIDSLDGLVWAVNSGNDSLNKLVIYLNEFAEQFLEAAGIACRFDVPQSVPVVPLSSEIRHNLFLIAKEALHNIVKHSGATEVWIRLRVDGGKLKIAIEDNGRGFAQGEVSALGNGLQNMAKRMRQTGGEFRIESAPGKGTKIKLEVPVTVEQ